MEIKLAVTLVEMSSQVVGSLAVEHDGTLAQLLLTGPGGGVLNKCLVDHN